MDHKLSFFLSLQFLYFVVSIDFNFKEEMEKMFSLRFDVCRRFIGQFLQNGYNSKQIGP